MMKNWLPYVLPFAVFGIITYAGPLSGLSPAVVYPAKTLVTGALLLLLLPRYRGEIRVRFQAIDILAGILVFAVWILLDPYYPQASAPGFNPYDHASGTSLAVLIGFRLAGAVLVVPVMEELFWRSFAMRYLITTKFTDIPLGTFTRFSFGITALAFGIEHHQWLAGIIAGIVYGFVLVRSKNLFSPIFAHGITNLMLGAYVLRTESWLFW